MISSERDARAVLSEKSENLARAQFKRYIVNRDSVALWIGFFQMFNFKHSYSPE
jgi:hypothetical protein